MLFLAVDDEEGRRQPAHGSNAAQQAVQLRHLVPEFQLLLLGTQIHLARELHSLKLVQSPQPLLNGLEVGKQPAQPALVHVELVGSNRFVTHGLLGLLLGADKEHLLTRRRKVANVLERVLQAVDGLLKVDDVNAVALREDVTAHLWVPAAGLMAEMDTRLQKLLHGNDRHSELLLWFVASAALRPERHPTGQPALESDRV